MSNSEYPSQPSSEHDQLGPELLLSPSQHEHFIAIMRRLHLAIKTESDLRQIAPDSPEKQEAIIRLRAQDATLSEIEALIGLESTEETDI